MNVGTTVMVTTWPACSSRRFVSLSFMPTTFWPLISSSWWSMSTPFRAADESLTIDEMRPSLSWMPKRLCESLCSVMERSNGRSRTTTEISLTELFLISLCSWSMVNPATSVPFIWRICVQKYILNDDRNQLLEVIYCAPDRQSEDLPKQPGCL